MGKNKLTKTTNIDVSAREMDFVTRFAQSWEALKAVLGITNQIKKTPGTRLVSYQTTVTLEDGNVAEGDEIPYSQAEVEEVDHEDVVIEKYAKAVTIESVNKYGATVAVQKTDDEFLNQLIQVVLTKFYTFILTGSLTSTVKTFQMALAMAKAGVIDKFNKMRKTVTGVVGFVNVLDAYEYLGAAELTIQTEFGMSYVKNFMGYETLFMLSDPDIPRGKVVAIPVENLDLYYVDPSDSEFAKLGLVYTTDEETNLIGFHAQGDYSHAVGASYALMGMSIWAEYKDGISVVTVDANAVAGTSSDEDLPEV